MKYKKHKHYTRCGWCGNHVHSYLFGNKMIIIPDDLVRLKTIIFEKPIDWILHQSCLEKLYV